MPTSPHPDPDTLRRLYHAAYRPTPQTRTAVHRTDLAQLLEHWATQHAQLAITTTQHAALTASAQRLYKALHQANEAHPTKAGEQALRDHRQHLNGAT